MQEYTTSCPRNCYSTCSFKVWTDKGRLVKIDPDPSNLATGEGPCLKGLSYIERVYSPQRILFPLKKVNSSFVRISWEEALNEIAQKLDSFKKKYGANSIFFYAASGMSGLLNSVSTNFWRMFGGATTVYGNLCWPAGLEATNLTLGENKHNHPWDLENAKFIVLWGKNPAESNIHQMVGIEKAQRKGAKLVVVDPRRTPSAERADILLQPKTGTDALLALCMAKIIVDENLHQTSFIDKNVLGFIEFQKSLQNINLEDASKRCGIPLEMIREVARMMGEIHPMTLIAGYGLQRFSNGGQTIRCLLSLPVITANIGVSGGGWQYANLQSYLFDKVKEPESYYPSEFGDKPFRRAVSTARLGHEMLEIKDPGLKMAWVERGNPLSQNPDSHKVLKAFKKLDFVVVVEQFMTDTAQEADIILPAKSMFEQSDIIGSYWNPYVSFKQKVIDPPEEVKPETEIYYLLAQKLGFPKEEIQKNIPAPTDDSIDEWLGKYLKDFPEISLEKLKKGPILTPQLENIAFENLVFKTPSGKIELFSASASEKWGVSPLPEYVPLVKNKSFPLHLMSPNTKNRIHSQFGNLSSIKKLDPFPFMALSPVDAQKRGIKAGNKARAFNEKGELLLLVKLDYSMRPGNVVIFNGYWNNGEGSPNILSEGKETDMGHGSAFHNTMIEVESMVAKNKKGGGYE